MLYMVVETFRGDPAAVYQRFRERGRMLPDGLRYVDSWVREDHGGCYQLMETDDPGLLRAWAANWDDLVEFQFIPVHTSAAAAARYAPGE